MRTYAWLPLPVARPALQADSHCPIGMVSFCSSNVAVPATMHRFALTVEQQVNLGLAPLHILKSIPQYSAMYETPLGNLDACIMHHF